MLTLLHKSKVPSFLKICLFAVLVPVYDSDTSRFLKIQCISKTNNKQVH